MINFGRGLRVCRGLGGGFQNGCVSRHSSIRRLELGRDERAQVDVIYRAMNGM